MIDDTDTKRADVPYEKFGESGHLDFSFYCQ